MLATLAICAVAPTPSGAERARRPSEPTITQAPVQFEVASIKANRSPQGKQGIQTLPGGRFTATRVTLRELIRFAYQLQDFQLTGGPDWLSTDRFDVVAKADGSEPGDPFQPGTSGGTSRGQLMLRALLADRFKLAVHHDTKELPIFALVLARNDRTPGAQLRRSAIDCAAARADDRDRNAAASSLAEPPRCDIRVLPGTIQAGGVSLAALASSLSPLVNRIVQDRTGLDASFEFILRWTPDQIPPGFDKKASAMGLAPIEPDGPSIFTALREQLGLRLDSQRGPVETLVVDRVERPSEN